ncbi:hypothetical protein CBR_g34788 [Chara braunii]|uniref:Uncharacterized protein n=1 Tax=Chara braunii TaxID=69332 RepID=A0A388LJL4_CHABU|nr:hypothetical protein CBR_g34788 [Chara braunii]|eukprot:GBG82412.1 hypothetical protein CBR_g34788 [Chara braunii]
MEDSNDWQAGLHLRLREKFLNARKDIWMGAEGDNTPLYIDVHPHKPWILLVAQQRSIQVWNHEEGRQIAAWDMPLIEEGTMPLWEGAKFVVRQNCMPLVVALRDEKSILMHQVQTPNFEWQRLKHLTAHQSRLEDMIFHPSLCYMITYSKKQIKLWAWSEGWSFKPVKYQLGEWTAVAFHPQGKILFAGASTSRKIMVWTGTKSSPKTFSAAFEMRALQFCSKHDKPLLVAGSWVGAIEVWNYQDGCRLTTLAGLNASISSVLFHPHLPYIMASSKDGKIAAWKDGEADDYELVMFSGSGLKEVCSMAPCLNSSMALLVLGGMAEFSVAEVLLGEDESQTDDDACTSGTVTVVTNRSSPVSSGIIECKVEDTAEILLQEASEDESRAHEALASSLELRRRAARQQAEKILGLESATRLMQSRLLELEEEHEKEKQKSEQLAVSFEITKRTAALQAERIGQLEDEVRVTKARALQDSVRGKQKREELAESLEAGERAVRLQAESIQRLEAEARVLRARTLEMEKESEKQKQRTDELAASLELSQRETRLQAEGIQLLEADPRGMEEERERQKQNPEVLTSPLLEGYRIETAAKIKEMEARMLEMEGEAEKQKQRIKQLGKELNNEVLRVRVLEQSAVVGDDSQIIMVDAAELREFGSSDGLQLAMNGVDANMDVFADAAEGKAVLHQMKQARQEVVFIDRELVDFVSAPN